MKNKIIKLCLTGLISLSGCGILTQYLDNRNFDDGFLERNSSRPRKYHAHSEEYIAPTTNFYGRANGYSRGCFPDWAEKYRIPRTIEIPGGFIIPSPQSQRNIKN